MSRRSEAQRDLIAMCSRKAALKPTIRAALKLTQGRNVVDTGFVGPEAVAAVSKLCEPGLQIAVVPQGTSPRLGAVLDPLAVPPFFFSRYFLSRPGPARAWVLNLVEHVMLVIPYLGTRPEPDVTA